jgi:ankyrin repeat protein
LLKGIKGKKTLAYAPDTMDDMFQHLPQSDNEVSSESEIQGPSVEESVLLKLMESYDWATCLSRIASHPSETKIRGEQGRTPLHVACDHDAPAVVIQSLLRAYPETSLLVGTSKMNALHITCSSHHASQHVVRVLLEGGKPEQCDMRDVDGDTPLHTACRCGAPIEVLEVLLRANPSAVHERDYEGLTPILRLWVRYTVILGDDAIESVNCAADLQGELLEAWKKTELLLHCAHQGTPEKEPSRSFWVVHAASAVDCPRVVLKIAARVFYRQLDEKDEFGRTPLLIAAQAPIYKVRDLSDKGFTPEDVIYEDETNAWGEMNDESQDTAGQPSVIEILLRANQDAASSSACVPDPLGRLPVHVALTAGKQWKDGIKQLIEVYAEALNTPDATSKLYPFMLAAEGWRGDISTTYDLLRRNPTLLADLHLLSHDRIRPNKD